MNDLESVKLLINNASIIALSISVSYLLLYAFPLFFIINNQQQKFFKYIYNFININSKYNLDNEEDHKKLLNKLSSNYYNEFTLIDYDNLKKKLYNLFLMGCFLILLINYSIRELILNFSKYIDINFISTSKVFLHSYSIAVSIVSSFFIVLYIILSYKVKNPYVASIPNAIIMVQGFILINENYMYKLSNYNIVFISYTLDIILIGLMFIVYVFSCLRYQHILNKYQCYSEKLFDKKYDINIPISLFYNTIL